MKLLEQIKENYDYNDRLKILSCYKQMINMLQDKKIYLDSVDKYILLFVFNTGNVTDLNDKKAILKWVKLYDAFDPLNRYDTAWELFIELDLIDYNDC